MNYQWSSVRSSIACSILFPTADLVNWATQQGQQSEHSLVLLPGWDLEIKWFRKYKTVSEFSCIQEDYNAHVLSWLLLPWSDLGLFLWAARCAPGPSWGWHGSAAPTRFSRAAFPHEICQTWDALWECAGWSPSCEKPQQFFDRHVCSPAHSCSVSAVPTPQQCPTPCMDNAHVRYWYWESPSI